MVISGIKSGPLKLNELYKISLYRDQTQAVLIVNGTKYTGSIGNNKESFNLADYPAYLGLYGGSQDGKRLA